MLAPRSTDECIPAQRYRGPDFERAAIARAGAEAAHDPSTYHEISREDDDRDVDLRIAVSRFTRHYRAAATG